MERLGQPTRQEIEEVLIQFKKCISDDRYIVSRRQKNDEFRNDYGITTEQGKQLLLGLEVTDFVKREYNVNPDYSPEDIIYIFSPKRLLRSFGEDKVIDLYIKFTFVDGENNLRTIIISLHKLEGGATFPFK